MQCESVLLFNNQEATPTLNMCPSMSFPSSACRSFSNGFSLDSSIPYSAGAPLMDVITLEGEEGEGEEGGRGVICMHHGGSQRYAAHTHTHTHTHCTYIAHTHTHTHTHTGVQNVTTPLVLLPVFLEGFPLFKDVVQSYQDPKCSANVLKHSLKVNDGTMNPFGDKKKKVKINAPCEDRTRDLQIMRLTRCLLR